MKIIPLGITVRDNATGLKGTLTHLQIELNGCEFYAFKPTGLNADTGKPFKAIWIVPSRIQNKASDVETELPIEILGSQVTSDASGFNGMAIALVLHVNGCVHIQIQPEGKLKSGEIITTSDFDIRECSGRAIAALSKKKLSESRKAKPSPSPIEPYSPSEIE